jgi:hypothetical protein
MAEPVRWAALAHRTLLAHAAADLGATACADGLIDELVPHRAFVASIGHSGSIGPVALAIGRLRALVGDVVGARSDLALARRLAERAGGRPAVLRVRLAESMLLPPGPARDTALRTLADDARRAGMHGVARMAR